jgi:hypothetical protein
MSRSNKNEPVDRDRLFARPIIYERARSLFGDNLQDVIDMPSEVRWRIGQSDPDDEDEGAPDVPPDVREVLKDIVADVEAWVVVEQARKASRSSQ